jgi:hypothetical protein
VEHAKLETLYLVVVFIVHVIALWEVVQFTGSKGESCSVFEHLDEQIPGILLIMRIAKGIWILVVLCFIFSFLRDCLHTQQIPVFDHLTVATTFKDSASLLISIASKLWLPVDPASSMSTSNSKSLTSRVPARSSMDSSIAHARSIWGGISASPVGFGVLAS